MGERMIQIGVAALRSPLGEFLPSIPLYIKEEDAVERNPTTGRTVQEDLVLTDVAKVFADKFKQYIDENRIGAGKTKKGIDKNANSDYKDTAAEK